MPKDDVYLVFDNRLTAVDIEIIVKSALGIEQTCELTPKIDVPTINIKQDNQDNKYGMVNSGIRCNDDAWSLTGKKGDSLWLTLNPTFIKLSFTQSEVTFKGVYWKININSGKMIDENNMLLKSFDKNPQTHTVVSQNENLPKSGGDIIKNIQKNIESYAGGGFSFVGPCLEYQTHWLDYQTNEDFSPLHVADICQRLVPENRGVSIGCK